ncbi:HalOD1 output domain-containing protein [Halogranum rubrum]|uniref:Halobacterial output domain-containing protein n=1 Tax=Halogranum salarium B-1 TaxID=1210908 RepID=J2ZW57_9EURY|nr:HalOD1 output domain-containing protein [Halogranum salarium]EJN57248.1 hypothetical protein HSB1_46340 [Halogranum salarium B-1]
MTKVDEDSSRQRAVSTAERDVYSVQHDWADETPIGTTVAKAVSAVAGVRPTDLEPLHSVVDTDALERLFEPIGDGPRPQQNYVHFPVSEHGITIYADGVIVVEAPNYDDIK